MMVRVKWSNPAALVAVAAVVAGLVLGGCGTSRGGAKHPGRQAAAADPPLVAVAGSSRHGGSVIEMISPATGRATKVVARVGTGNGFALSPDSKNLYVVGPVGAKIEIRRISVATGKVSFVADGAYPAVGPDGRYLAYATGHQFTTIAVRDLRTGRTRTLGLRSLLGKNGNLLNQGAVSWLGDGSELIVLPGIAASVAAADGTAGATGKVSGIQAPPGRQNLVIVKVGPHGLGARRIVVLDPYQNPFQVVSGDLSQPRAFLIARMGFGGAGTITRVTLGNGGFSERLMAKLPTGVMPVAIAPRGDGVLYLVGHTPPVLWAAAIKNGRLTGQHRLFADTSKFGVDQAAW